MRKFTIVIALCLTLTGFTFISAHAWELTKGIHYLGIENGVKSYEITCSNGKEGKVYVNTNTREITVKDKDGFIQDLGHFSFGDAVKKICRGLKK